MRRLRTKARRLGWASPPLVQVVVLEPDDKLVLSCQERLSSEAVERIKATAGEIFDGFHKRVIVLDGGAKLSVLRQATTSGLGDD